MRGYNEAIAEDRLSRKRIQTETETNLFVEASAGSGKTTKLVERMVSMVGAGVDIRRICAITFTVNASREFYRRFRAQLSLKRYDAQTPEEQRNRYRDALENIDLCFLGTIDSFCQMILSEHPMEAGIPSDAVLISADEMAAYCRRELTRAANGEYGPEILKLYRFVSSMFYRADSRILSAMPQFMGTRDTLRVYDAAEDLDVESAFSSEIGYLRKLYSVLDGHPEFFNGGTAASRAVRDKAGRTKRILNKSWNRNLSEVFSELKSLKDLRLSCAPEALGLEESSLFTPRGSRASWYDCSVCEPGHVGYELNELAYSCFMEFMDKFSRKAGENIRRSGVLDFYDYQYCLLQMLRADVRSGGQLIRHIRGRHSYFLVDEFQDTNPMQAEILFYLTSEEPVENWRECKPYPGSLFIVGDPKQSIYRFRGADVNSYLDVKALFESGAGDTVKLFDNFRSSKRLCVKFNSVYSRLFPDADTENQSRYEAIPVDSSSGEPGISGIFSYEGSTVPELDAEAVTAVIRHIVGNPGLEIYDKALQRSRMIAFRDIMVITFGKKSLDTYMLKCAEHNIPAFVEGKTVFSDCAAMRLITYAAKALSHPEDAMCVYGALTSGLFDIDDAMLSGYCRGGNRLRLRRSYSGSAPEGTVESALFTLSSLLRLADNASPVALFDGILSGLPVFARAGTKHLEYVFFARELLRRGETDGTVTDASEAARYLEDILSDRAGLERSLNLSGDPDCVHFANLHKVKGLEAPVVILANSYTKRSFPPRLRTERQGNVRASYVFRVGEGYNMFTGTGKYKDKELLEKASEAAENERLLYVAGTRAENILIVSDIGKPAEKQSWGLFLPECGDSVFRLGADSTHPFPVRGEMDVSEVISSAGKSAVFKDASLLEKSYKLVRPGGVRVRGGIEEEENEAEDAPEESEKPAHRARADAALTGTLVHKLMEIIMSSRGRVNTDDAVEAILSGFSFSEDEKAEHASCLRTVAATILTGGYKQSSSPLKDIFGEVMGADEYYCEYPVCCRDGDILYHGIIDLVYRKGGQWFIVDYKTNADPDDLDLKYRGQLQAYVTILKNAEDISAQAMTYHIDVQP